MSIKTETIVQGEFVYLIVTDPAAGRRGRYTVHEINLWGYKGAKVIGGELPIGHARRLVRGRRKP